MTNNFDLRKFLTENKLTSVAKTVKEAEEPQAGEKVASDKLNLTGVNAEINNAKSFAKAVIGLANKLGEREGFNPESNPHIRKAMEFLNAAAGNVAQEEGLNESEVNELHGGYLEVMGDEFHIAAKEIAKAWVKWKNGPATEPEDIEPAREDVIDFLKMMVR